MSAAFNQFRLVQVGKETVKGTGVAATKKLRGDLTTAERISRYYSMYPQGYRANPGGTGVAVAQGFGASFASELTFEEILWFLLTGIKGGVTGAGAGTDKTWDFTPQLTTAPTLDAMTMEYTESDGSTNHVARNVAYGMTKGFKVDWAFNQEAKFSADVFGRYPTSAAPTAALTEYSAREIAKSNLLKVFMDTTWAGLGGTQLTGFVRTASLEVVTGNEEDFNLDGRTTLDMTGHRFGLVQAKLNMLLQLDANGANAIGNWRNGDTRFIRLSQFGSLLTGIIFKEIRFDLAARFIGDGEPGRATDGQYRTANIQVETLLDPTSSKTFVPTVVNSLAAV
mgnify:CR=1 FL=1